MSTLYRTKKISEWSFGVEYLKNNPDQLFVYLPSSDEKHKFLVINDTQSYYMYIYQYNNIKWICVSRLKYP